MEIVNYSLQGYLIYLLILCFLANTCTIKGVGIFYQTFITVQDIERSSQVPAQAVTGDTDLFAITNQFLVS